MLGIWNRKAKIKYVPAPDRFKIIKKLMRTTQKITTEGTWKHCSTSGSGN
jgi:hypothetical protein